MGAGKILSAVTMGLGLALLSGCFQVSDQELGVQEIDGVPVFWENGIPYFTRFAQTDHRILDLAGTWKFQPDPEDLGVKEQWFRPELDDRGWFDHPVPGSWNVQKPEWLNYVGAGWYRVRFKPGPEFEGKFNRLVLDGVSFKCNIYLNGNLLGSHSGGFSRFSLDVSDKLKPGQDNLLALRVDNRRDWESLPPIVHEKGPLGWWPYAGIHHQALIESSPEITLCKLAVNAEPDGRIKIQAAVYNNRGENAGARVRVALEDLSGNLVAQMHDQEISLPSRQTGAFTIDRKIDGIKPWSLDHPENRYLVRVTVSSVAGGENQAVETGFRRFETRGDRLYLNGAPIFVKGVNRHEDDPLTGRVQTDQRINQDLALLRELNANIVRTSHYPADPRFLDACDRAGVLVMEEISLHQVGWEYQGVRAAEKKPLYLNAARELVETIERDRNHPSLVIYSLGDESFTFLPAIRIFHQRLYDLAKRFDRERPITLAIVTVPWRVTPWLEMTAGVGDIISVNEYYGWYYSDLNRLAPFLDAVRKSWPRKPVIVSELGAEGVPGLMPGKSFPIGYGKAKDFTEEGQLQFIKSQFETIKTRPYISGVMVWVFADHRDDKRPKSAVPLMNTKGLLTYDRNKKQAFTLVSEFYRSWAFEQ